MGKIFFALISNKTTCLLCGYQPICVKKYNVYKHYKITHAKEYSKYVDEKKANLIEV